MATVTESTYTPEDLLDIQDRPMPELIDGEMVEREMSFKSDLIAALMIHYLNLFVLGRQLGVVSGSHGSYQIFPDHPNRVRIPDVSYTSRERLKKVPDKGHGRVVPDLIVEVTSPNDTIGPLQGKIADFLSVGVRLIWIIYPESQTVQVVRADGSGILLKIGDAIDGEDVLPGFRCEVAALFEPIEF